MGWWKTTNQSWVQDGVIEVTIETVSIKTFTHNLGHGQGVVHYYLLNMPHLKNPWILQVVDFISLLTRRIKFVSPQEKKGVYA